MFEASHAQGGVSGYAHHGQLFNGRRGLALDVPFGLVDFIEVLQGGRLDTAAWYPFLNLGYKVSPAAGSDYPYFGPSLPGAERYYVKLDRDVRRRTRGTRRSRPGTCSSPTGRCSTSPSTASRWAKSCGSRRGRKLDIAAAAQLNPDIDQLGRLEIVVHGDVVATQPAKGLDHVAIRKTLVADRSMWIAVRAFGTREAPAQGAGAGDGAGRAQRADLRRRRRPAVLEDVARLPQLVKEQRQHLQDLLTAPVDPMGDLEAWETVDVLSRQWERQRQQLRPRVSEAEAKYDAILKRATGAPTPTAPRSYGSAGIMLGIGVGLISMRFRKGTR